MTANEAGNPTEVVHVLLVEDNPADVDMVQDILANSACLLKLSVAIDGEDALDFLRRKGGHENVERPQLILLDLNLPRLNGHEVLRELKEDQRFKLIPVIVLSSSQRDADIGNCHEMGANCYITKPLNLTEYEKIVRAVESFWCKIALLPQEQGFQEDEGPENERSTS